MRPPSEIQSLFGQAMEIASTEERERFLDRVCGGDAELRREIEELLRAHQQAGRFLQGPDTIDLPAGLPIGSMIGPYRLMEEIGEGGMGLVYVAEQQEPVRRQVALKVIKPGMDTREVIARFEAERQALALMDHPNIAKVLDAGATEAGRPYFVMELVRGIPLTDFCDQNRLPPRERLQLVAEVCRAVQHAHQKGVIHRDLKPSNILVTLHDGRPVPKVIDFGVAKAIGQRLTARTVYTRFLQVVGTPLYMSPEQAEMSGLDIDTRSDVYSLGVLLYELLTGSTPLDRQRLADAAVDEWRRIICEEEPPKPSTRLSDSADRLPAIAAQRQTAPDGLTRLVRGDLDWIVMKSLEKDRSRRYESPSALARDIERFLGDQPIEARPPSTLYRIQKWLRRNRVAAYSSLIGIALIVGLGIWSWSAEVERQQRAAATARQMSTALENAALSLGKAINAPVGRDVEWAIARTQRDRVAELVREPTLPAVEQFRANAYLKRFTESEADRRVAAEVEDIVIFGATHPDKMSWTRMEERFRALFRDAGIDLDRLPPPEVAERIKAHPSADRLVDALELWLGTRGSLSGMGGPKVTQESMRPWAQALYAADADPVRTGIRRLMYDRPMGSVRPPDVEAVIRGHDLTQLSPRTLSWLATSFAMAGDAARCDEIYQLALRLHPGDFMVNFDYAFGLQSQKRWQEAIRYFMRCTVVRPGVAGVWRGLGVALRHTGELAQSRAALMKAIELQPKHAPTYVDLAETLLAMRDRDAVATATIAVQLDPTDPMAHGCLGRALMEAGDFPAALAALQKCHELATKAPGRPIPSQQWLDECRRRMAEKPVTPAN